MSKFCGNCGASLNDDAEFCGNCGAPQGNGGQPQGNAQYNQQYNNQQYGNQQYQGNNSTGIHKRSIPLAIVLSIITCGIYAIVWMASLNNDMYIANNEPIETTGGMVVLLTIVTCGIYGWFWYYKMGEKVDRLKGVPGNSTVLFLILGIFGLGIVNYALMQDTLNKCA